MKRWKTPEREEQRANLTASAKVVTPLQHTPTPSRHIRSQTRIKSKLRESSGLTVVAFVALGKPVQLWSVWDGSVCSRGADESVLLLSPTAAPRNVRSSLPHARLHLRHYRTGSPNLRYKRAVNRYHLQFQNSNTFIRLIIFFSIGKIRKMNWKVKDRLRLWIEHHFIATAVLFAELPLLFSLYPGFKSLKTALGHISKSLLRSCACAYAFMHLCNGTTNNKPTNNNKLPSVQQSPTVVRCVLTVEKTWLTTFVGIIKAAVICFYYRIGGSAIKALLSDVNLSHNNTWSHHVYHKQRRWHNNHLSVVQYSAGKTLGPSVSLIYVASPGWRTRSTTLLTPYELCGISSRGESDLQTQQLSKSDLQWGPKGSYKSHRCSVNCDSGECLTQGALRSRVQAKDLAVGLQELTCAHLGLRQHFLTHHGLLLNAFCCGGTHSDFWSARVFGGRWFTSTSIRIPVWMASLKFTV